MIPLVYCSAYNITAFGLERRHPFDGCKYRRIHDWLIHQGLRKAADFTAPPKLTRRELLAIHTAKYLDSLGRRDVLARAFEVPIVSRVPACLVNWRILRPMRSATAGTILACRLALQRGLAINIGGGYHHASGDRAGGFCIYADVPLALHLLHTEQKIAAALVVDTDVHQGDGTADAIRPWPWAALLDFFEEDLFPSPKVKEEHPVPLSPGLNGAEYMDALRDHLPAALDRYHPDIVVYNAGSDVLWSDPLGHLFLTADDLAERDLFVATQARERGVPLAIVLSGGYGRDSWLAHARSIESVLTRFDRDVAGPHPPNP
jgi:histone deacetylase 11